MAPPFARHVLLFLVAAAVTAAVWTAAPPAHSPVLWLAGGAAAGVVAGVLARGVVGPIVVGLGFLVGLAVVLQASTGGEWPVDELGAASATLLGTLGAALAGYAAARILLRSGR